MNVDHVQRVATSIRLPRRFLADIDDLAERLGKDPTVAPIARMSRSRAIRILLRVGLDVLAERGPGPALLGHLMR